MAKLMRQLASQHQQLFKSYFQHTNSSIRFTVVLVIFHVTFSSYSSSLSYFLASMTLAVWMISGWQERRHGVGMECWNCGPIWCILMMTCRVADEVLWRWLARVLLVWSHKMISGAFLLLFCEISIRKYGNEMCNF